MLLDDKTTWWPLHASRPEPHEEIAPALNLQLAAIHAPIAMAGASALLFFNHGERLHFARAFPAFGLVLVGLVVALRFAIAYAWNVRARRLRDER